ncbi:hypothetical protein [Desulfovibrio porci]|uniref:hypothetical protein n=1 Tax=Desulfovibrio porci TaxID=2605782 RepID=UPI003A94FC3C
MQSTTKIEGYRDQTGFLEALAKELEGTDRFFFVGARISADGKFAPMYFTGPGMGPVGAMIGALTPKFVSALIEIVEEKLAEMEASASPTTH